MKRVTLILLFALFLFLAPVAFAQGTGAVPSPDAWLKAASGPLISAIAGVALSLLIGYWKSYGALDPRTKRLLFFGICLAVSLLAATARGVLGYAAWSFENLYWPAIWYALIAGGAGTLSHTGQLPTAEEAAGRKAAEAIYQARASGLLSIVEPDGHVVRVPYTFLREKGLIDDAGKVQFGAIGHD